VKKKLNFFLSLANTADRISSSLMRCEIANKANKVPEGINLNQLLQGTSDLQYTPQNCPKKMV
jgi:hypothetical protein